MKKIFLYVALFACICANVISMNSDDQKEYENWEKSKILIQEITGTTDDCWGAMTKAKNGDVRAQSAIRKILEENLVLDLSFVIVEGFLERDFFCTELVKTSWEREEISHSILSNCINKHYFSCLYHILFGKDKTIESLLTLIKVDEISVLEQMWEYILKGANENEELCYAVIHYIYLHSLNPQDSYYQIQRELIESNKSLLGTLLKRFPYLKNQRDLFMKTLVQH